MFYGNFDELKFIYAAREVPELSEYIRKINEFNEVKSKMTSIVASQGLKVLNEQMAKAKTLGSEIQKAKTALLEKLHVLKDYKITEEDIENMYSQQG